LLTCAVSSGRVVVDIYVTPTLPMMNYCTKQNGITPEVLESKMQTKGQLRFDKGVVYSCIKISCHCGNEHDAEMWKCAVRIIASYENSVWQADSKVNPEAFILSHIFSKNFVCDLDLMVGTLF